VESAFSGTGAGIGTIGGVTAGIVIGIVLFYLLKNRKARNEAEEG